MRFFSLLLFCSLAGCAASPVTRAEVDTLMEVQRAAWNRGDLAEFVAYYDPTMTFSGEEITRGTADLLERYRKGYPTPEARGTLTFQILDVRPLGAQHAVVLGRFHLARKKPSSGYFTLVVERTPDGLRVLHDHTTGSPEKGTGK